MIRYSIVLCIVALSLCLSLSALAQTQSQPLHFAFLRTVAPGEFPVEHWSAGQEDQLDASIRTAKTVMGLVKQISSDDAASINDAFEMRIGVLRWNDASPSISSVLQKYSKLIGMVQSIGFPELVCRSERINFEEVTSTKLKAFWQLIVLATVDYAARNDFEHASNVLAGGFAASRWWQHADAYETIIRALILEERLHHGLVALQAIGAPILDTAISKLRAGMVTNEYLEQAIWNDLCEEFPIFKRKHRDNDDWKVDLKTTFNSFGVSPESATQLLSTIDCVRVGRRLQQESAKQLQSVGLASLVESSDSRLEGAKGSQGSRKAAEDRVVEIISSSVDQLVPFELSQKFSMDARQRLMALKCVEVLRKESRKRGQWIIKIDKPISDRFPQDPRTGLPFDLQATVLEPFGFPYYALHLASPGATAGDIYIQFGTQAKYGKEDQ